MITERIYYETAYCREFDVLIEEIREDREGTWIRLDATAFYPEGGGQPCDIGTLTWNERISYSSPLKAHRMNVVDVQEQDDVIWHRVEPVSEADDGRRGDRECGDRACGDKERGDKEFGEGKPAWWSRLCERVREDACGENNAGEGGWSRKNGASVPVCGAVNWNRRLDLMQQHSGEHMVSGLIHERFGYDNVGFHLSMDSMTIDLSGELTWNELMEIEAAANRLVRENRSIEIDYPSEYVLKQLPYRSKKELTGEVRIVTIPGADICACCGTHVSSTGEIGLIKITAMQKWKSGVRVWMCCGERAENYCRMVQEQNRQISVTLSAKPEETASAVERVSAELNQLKMTLTGWKYRYYAEVAKRYEEQKNAVIFEDDLSMDDLRHLADKVMDTCLGECFVFSGKDGEGYRYTVGKRGGDVRDLVREMNAALSGRGGGKSEMAQGTVQAARAEIENWVSLRTES